MEKIIKENNLYMLIKKRKLTVFLLTLGLTMLMAQFTVASATDLNTELVTNGGAESGTAGTIPGWTDDTGQGRWSSSAQYSDWALPAAGSRYFFMYNPSMDYLSGTMSQEITLSGTEGSGLFAGISAGNVSVNFSVSMFQNISADNEAKAVLEEYAADGVLLKTSQVSNTTSSGTAMGPYQINTQLNPGTRKLKVILSAILTRGGYAQFDKVSLKLVDASTGSAPVFGSDFPALAETDAGVTYSSSFTISDADTGDVDHLTFGSSSTNVNLVPAANITVSGSGGNRTLTIVPAGNLSGEADITVSASDGTKSAEKNFHFVVHKVISMDTNLVENGNGTSGLASWSGNTVNIRATGDGFIANDPDASMSQNIDISKYSALINGGETNFLMSAVFPDAYAKISAQFYTDIACTNAVGSSYSVNRSAASLQQKIPANAMGVKMTFTNTHWDYPDIVVKNISFQIVNDFPKISPISAKTTNLSALTVPAHTYYTTAGATLTAASSDQTIVPDSGIAVGGSGFDRTVTFTPLKAGSVTITLTLSDGSRSVSAGFSVTVFETAVVSGVDLPAAGFYGAGGQLDFTVHFSHNITGGTDSTLPLSIGGASAAAVYLSGTADSITYRYIVGGSDSGAVSIGTAIDDTSSPITDTAGYDAETGISAGATGVTAVQPPRVTSTAAGGSATYGTGITFTAALDCSQSLSGAVRFKANGADLGSPVTVSGNTASYETAATAFDAESVSITAEFVPSGSDIHFASLTSSDYTVTILPKQVTASANVSSKVYDGNTNAAVSLGFAPGAICPGDVVNVSAAGTFDNKNAGAGKPVTLSGVTKSGADADNYDIGMPSGLSADIARRDIEITPEPATKPYGAADPAFTYHITSGALVGSESLAGSLSRAAGEAVGEYTITQGTVTNENNANYNITFAAGAKLTVAEVYATISPDTGGFDKKIANQADVQTAISWGSAAYVTDIKTGGVSIGADNYGVSGSALTIKKEYLAAQATGSLTLTVEFNAGASATLTIAVTDTTPPAISPTSRNYNLNAPADIITTISWNSAASVTGVGYDVYTLRADTDFVLVNNDLSIKNSYLSDLTLTAGDALDFDIAFDTGAAATLTVHVVSIYIPSNNANLSSLSVNGTPVSGFDPNDTEYDVELPYGASSAIVAATADDPLASRVIADAPSLPGSAAVTVTAEDKTTTKTYTINFTIGAAPFVSVTNIAVTGAGGAENVQVGNSLQMVADISPANSTDKSVTWSIESGSGAAINASGLLTATAAGTVTVRAAANDSSGVYGEKAITITEAPPVFVAVTGITGVPTAAAAGTPLAMTGTVAPANATNQTIVWSVLNAGTTGATISGGTLSTTAAGTLIVRATIINGASESTNYTQDFTVTVSAESSGSDDDGGDTPSTPSTPTYNADVKADDGPERTLPVTVDKDAGTASVNAGSQGFAQNGTVVMMPSIPDVDTYSVGIPISELSTSDVRGTLTVNTDTGSITVLSNMLTGVSGAGGNKAEIAIGQGDKDNLPDEVKAAIGDKPIIRLTLSIDGKQTDWSNPNAPVTVSIPYTPTAEELVHPESIVVWYVDGSGNVVTIPNGHYDPATGTVTVDVTHFSDYAVAYNKVSFNDVSAGAWYNRAVSFIAAREITTGTENDNFNPEAKLTRGEFIVMLMKAYGISPDTNPADNFADSGNTWYTGYLAAAKRLGISAGVGSNMYAPDKKITRQEMFTLLYNALKVSGRLPQGNPGKTLDQFTDAGQIDAWAKDAMALLVKTGTVSGNAGKLTPTGTTTRAEMAQVLYHLLSK